MYERHCEQRQAQWNVDGMPHCQQAAGRGNGSYLPFEPVALPNQILQLFARLYANGNTHHLAG